MRTYIGSFLIAALAVSASLLLAGCDGEGLQIVHNPRSGDQPPGQDDGVTPNPPPGPGQPDTRFSGRWVASFGDDFTTGLTSRDGMEYSAQMQITQQNAAISGSGTLYRFLRQGGQAWERHTFTVSGTASGSDATLTIRPAQGAAFDAQPVWHLRLASNRMIGIFQETTPNGSLIRAGHADWFRTSSGGVDGAWMATVSDRFAVSGVTREERTGSVTLAETEGNTLTGQGSFDTQTNSGSITLDFNVTRGGVDAPDVDFTFGELDLAGNEFDWLGFLGGGAIVSAYGQFDAADRLMRIGHATWYRGSEPTTGAISQEWVTAFEDSTTATNAPGNDYLASVTLQAQPGGAVTGTGTMRVVGDTETVFPVTVVNGNLLGSRLHIELRGGNRTFLWDLRTAGTLLVGSYRQVNASGDFVSRGTGEWRTGGNLNLVGSWTAAFFDTYGALNPENTQLALITITRSDAGGLVTGLGWLRYAGDTRRRLFNIEGDATDDEVILVWRPQDQFGDTVWRIRQAGNFLYGTYVNEDSGGLLEARGKALWFRTNRTDTLTQ